MNTKEFKKNCERQKALEIALRHSSLSGWTMDYCVLSKPHIAKLFPVIEDLNSSNCIVVGGEYPSVIGSTFEELFSKILENQDIVTSVPYTALEVSINNTQIETENFDVDEFNEIQWLLTEITKYKRCKLITDKVLRMSQYHSFIINKQKFNNYRDLRGEFKYVASLTDVVVKLLEIAKKIDWKKLKIKKAKRHPWPLFISPDYEINDGIIEIKCTKSFDVRDIIQATKGIFRLNSISKTFKPRAIIYYARHGKYIEINLTKNPFNLQKKDMYPENIYETFEKVKCILKNEEYSKPIEIDPGYQISKPNYSPMEGKRILIQKLRSYGLIF